MKSNKSKNREKIANFKFTLKESRLTKNKLGFASESGIVSMVA